MELLHSLSNFNTLATQSQEKTENLMCTTNDRVRTVLIVFLEDTVYALQLILASAKQSLQYLCTV